MLADGIEVRGAHLDNGLLHIDMERVIPESQARKIPINSKSALNGANGGAKRLAAIDIENTPRPAPDTKDKKGKK